MNEPIIRELKEEDIDNGFLKSLDTLTLASDIGKTEAVEVFERINSNPDYVIAVAELEGKIVGTTTLFIESKFIHKGGFVGHIEDVSVDSDFHGQKIGQKIMEYLLKISKKVKDRSRGYFSEYSMLIVLVTCIKEQLTC